MTNRNTTRSYLLLARILFLISTIHFIFNYNLPGDNVIVEMFCFYCNHISGKNTVQDLKLRTK